MENLLDQLIDFLEHFQNDNGSFSSYSSFEKNFESPEYIYTTVFTTAFVLDSLCNVKNVNRIQKKAADFLLSNKSDNGTWNYWDRKSSEYTELPYPDDIDDTFSALAALQKYDPDLNDGKTLAHTVKGLTTLEIAEGGPYFTWYTKSNKAVWKDCDCVANAQVAYFLKMLEVELPNLSKYFEKIADIKKLSSPYYPSALHCMYFISRTYQNELLGDVLSEYLKKNELNPLEMALGISSLIRQGRDSEELVQKFHRFNIDTLIKAYPFCIDPSRENKKYFSGSPAITAAATIEALSLMKTTRKISRLTNSLYFDAAYSAVLHLKNKLPQSGHEDFKKYIEESLNSKAGKSCVMAPILVTSSLGKIPEKTLDNICFAQACGWAAYEILDDCVDEQKVDSLGISTVLFSEMYRTFSTLFSSDQTYVENFKKRVDEMNMSLVEEAHHIKSKDPTTTNQSKNWMIHKSSGYVLGPLAVLHAYGFEHKSKTTKAITSFFENLIVALQLSDDAHDWEDDIKYFRRNGVVEMLPRLTEAKSTEYFWKEGLDEVLKKIYFHCQKARSAITPLENKTIFENLVTEIENMAAKTKRERDIAQEFLQEY